MFFTKRSVEQFERDVVQELVAVMMSMKIVSTPIMHFLKNGNPLRDAYIKQLLYDPGIASMIMSDYDRSFLVLAYHSLGAGAYLAVKSGEGEDISSTNTPSGQKLLEDMKTIGSIELGLKSMCIDLQSNNKKVIDHLMLSSISSILKEYSKEMHSKQKDSYVTTLMNLYFNVGVTLAMVRTGCCP